MRLGALGQVHLLDDRVVDEAHALALRFFGQVVLEDAAVDLVALHRQHMAGAEFGDLVDVAPAFAEEEAEAELAQLGLLHVRLEAQHGVEVVRADLDAGLAHLVRRDRHRVRPALDHQHGYAGEALLQLQRQGQAGQAAAHDDHVVVGHRAAHSGSIRRFSDSRADKGIDKVSGCCDASASNTGTAPTIAL